MSIEDFIYPFLSYYNRSPQFIRTFTGKVYRLIPLSLRYGEVYKYYYNLLKESCYWDEEKKQEFIVKNVKKSLLSAYNNTEYYKTQFDKIGFNPNKFNNLSELEHIPFSDKTTLRVNKALLINKNISKNKLLYSTTGGTSGIPVEVFFVKGRERSREYAFMTNQWKRIGYKEGDKIAVIRGGVVDHKGNNTFFKYEPVKNRMLFSTYDLYEENFPLYIKQLKKFNPDFIHTYPSAIVVLAKYIIKENISISSLKGVFCSSEQFYPGQRELIEAAFNARVYSWYGHTEGTTLAGECEHNNDYHIYFEYGYTELIDENGKVITEHGKQGEIVGTSFEMNAFPIIRYRTGDFAEYVEEKCKCGRNYTLIRNIKGRWVQEKIITKRNSGISLTSLNMHSDLFNEVIQFQFHQKVKGIVELKLVKSKNFNESHEKKIRNAFMEKFKDLVDMEIVFVNTIDRTGVGKHKFLVQELKEN